MGAVRALVPKGVTLRPFVSSVSFVKLGSDGNLYILDDEGTPVFCVSNICDVLPFAAPTARETTAESKTPAERVVLKDMGDDDEVVLVSEVPLIGVKPDRSDW